MSEVDNFILPNTMYMAYHYQLGWFYSSLSDNEQASVDELRSYQSVDMNKVVIKKVRIEEILP
jgi:hypothetical protein